VKALKDAASYITTAWKDQSTKRTGPGHNSDTASTRLADARLTALEEENAALRQELSRRPACAHECLRCSGSVPAPGLPPRTGESDNDRINALEKRLNELRPSIIRAIEGRFGDRRPRTPESRSKPDHSATLRATQTSALPKEQGGDEWRVVESKKRKKTEKKKQEKTVATAGEETKKEATAVTPARITGTPRPSTATATTKNIREHPR
jgi:hypothetical protein